MSVEYINHHYKTREGDLWAILRRRDGQVEGQICAEIGSEEVAEKLALLPELFALALLVDSWSAFPKLEDLAAVSELARCILWRARGQRLTTRHRALLDSLKDTYLPRLKDAPREHGGLDAFGDPGGGVGASGAPSGVAPGG